VARHWGVDIVTVGRSGRVRALALVGAVLLFATGFTHVERVSVSRTGGQAGAGGWALDLSRTGRYSLVVSSSPLDQADASGESDQHTYRRDNLTGNIRRVDAGVPGDGCCARAMSADGRTVLFSARTGPGGGARLYVRDIATGTVTLESVLGDGTPIDSFYIYNEQISRDGRYMAFSAGADMFDYRLYWRDRLMNRTEVLGPAGRYGGVVLSGDGLHLVGAAERFHQASVPVSFDAGGPTYPPIPGGQWVDASDNGRYLTTGAVRFDRVTGQYVNAPLPVGGASGASISGDGRFISFTSDNAALLPLPNTALPYGQRSYLWDTASAQIRRLDLSATGQHPNSPYGGAGELTRTGRYATYYSLATNVVANDTNGAGDSFVVDAAVPRPTSTSTNRPRGATNVPVVVRGGFMLRDALADFGPGITVHSSEPAANGGIRFFITIAPNAARGLRDVGIANAGMFGLVSGACRDCFRVT
jgi:hypothetical protein